MEDLNKIFKLSETYPLELERISEEFLLKLRVILWGEAVNTINQEKLNDLPVASPRQTKKRVKRLTSLNEDNEVEEVHEDVSIKSPSTGITKRSNEELLTTADAIKYVNIEAEIQKPVAAPRLQTVASAPEKEIIDSSEEMCRKTDAKNLMPPPPIPVVASADETLHKRPQRAAKLKSEKNLKEPKLSTKLRRPTNNELKIKLEHEQRPSQMHESVINNTTSKLAAPTDTKDNTIAKNSLLSRNSDDSIVVVPGKQISILSITSDVDVPTSVLNTEENINQNRKEQDPMDNGIRNIRIKIKREKSSLSNQEQVLATDKAVFKEKDAVPLPLPLTKSEITPMEESSMAPSVLSSIENITTADPPKKGRKKRDMYRPIKIERFSDLDSKPSPISSRTRNGSLSKTENNDGLPTKESKRQASIYEDAVETPPSRNSKDINNAAITAGTVNDTVNLGVASDVTMNLGSAPSNATFCTNSAQTNFQVATGQTTLVMDANPNATVTLHKHSEDGVLADATFDVHQVMKASKDKDNDFIGQGSFETAKDSLNIDYSLLTEEDEQEKSKVSKSKVSSTSKTTKGATKSSTLPKSGYKMSARKNELFNPLAQSPVKMRVEAFENAAAAATENSKRLLRSKKENVTSTSATTPVIGKLTAPALGRFLTPTQGSNIGVINSAIARKGVTSASKALPMPKSANASSLQRSNSAVSSKTLQRENSADDFRKGLQNLVEERKKQREQKHLLAAQQREAKERERAERIAKLAKERDEKRQIKKRQEQEQKKRELEEIQRKLRQQQDEEAAKIKAAKERDLLRQMKQQQLLAKQKMMPPPPPKQCSEYVFEMLHEDDSTDDEDKVSDRRPPPPQWSRSYIRGPYMLKQEFTPSAYIDSFFSVQPMTPDLKIIFPNIDARHLKRNSSVLWSTPPRYSELPKY